jgi:hypothetical protein
MKARATADGRYPAAWSSVRLIAAGLLVCSFAMFSGCASTTPDEFVEEPGVPVRVVLTSGGSVSGTLVGLEEGALIIDRSLSKSPQVAVVSKDGADVVYLNDVPIGTAVEIRAVDILVRERLDFFEVSDVRVVSKAYFGWGTGIAAVLAFLLAQALQDT